LQKNSKIKKPLSVIIFSQNGTRSAEKVRKNILVPNSVPTQPKIENFKKKSKKFEKILKPLSSIIFSPKGMR